MFCKLLRPPSINGFRGKGDNKPDTLGLIKLLILDKFIQCILESEEPKITMIFVQSYTELIAINNHLLVKLKSVLDGKSLPWIINDSSVGKLTKIENQRRVEAGEIKLFVTTR